MSEQRRCSSNRITNAEVGWMSEWVRRGVNAWRTQDWAKYYLPTSRQGIIKVEKSFDCVLMHITTTILSSFIVSSSSLVLQEVILTTLSQLWMIYLGNLMIIGSEFRPWSSMVLITLQFDNYTQEEVIIVKFFCRR